MSKTPPDPSQTTILFCTNKYFKKTSKFIFVYALITYNKFFPRIIFGPFLYRFPSPAIRLIQDQQHPFFLLSIVGKVATMDDYKKNLNVAEINSIQKRCVYEVNEVIDNTPSCPSCHKPFGNKMDLAAHQSASKHFGGLNWTAHCCGTFFRSYEDCFAHFR